MGLRIYLLVVKLLGFAAAVGITYYLMLGLHNAGLIAVEIPVSVLIAGALLVYYLVTEWKDTKDDARTVDFYLKYVIINYNNKKENKCTKKN